MIWFGRLNLLAIVLVLLVIPLGAYTRLTDAGLGCPDWPGCYGQLAIPVSAQTQADVQSAFPQSPLVPHKARNEMVHRYIAGLLGLSVLGLFGLALGLGRWRLLSGGILLLVVLQAALGMWTVTLNLLPLVVMAHLLGGFSLLSLLVLLRLVYARNRAAADGNNAAANLGATANLGAGAQPFTGRLLGLGYVALAVLVGQILLGGWTSANYAATICHQLPLCESGWQAHFSLAAAFHLPLGHASYEFGVLDYAGRMSIHVLHRLGALVTLLVVGSYGFCLWRQSEAPELRRVAVLLATLLSMQLVLGLINVIAQVPLWNALAHNFVGANLLMMQVASLFYLTHARSPRAAVMRALNPVQRSAGQVTEAQ